MPTDLSFVATNPDGSTVSLKPIEYRADWPHMGYQRLSFQCFDGQTAGCNRSQASLFPAGQWFKFICHCTQSFVPRNGFEPAIPAHQWSGDPVTGILHRVVASVFTQQAMVNRSVPIAIDTNDAVVVHK